MKDRSEGWERNMGERWERKRERKDGNEVWKRNEREMEAVKGEES